MRDTSTSANERWSRTARTTGSTIGRWAMLNAGRATPMARAFLTMSAELFPRAVIPSPRPGISRISP